MIIKPGFTFLGVITILGSIMHIIMLINLFNLPAALSKNIDENQVSGLMTYEWISWLAISYWWAELYFFVKWFRGDNLQTRLGLEKVFMIALVGNIIA